MSKKIPYILIFLLFLGYWPCLASGRVTLPTFKVVVDKFFSSYYYHSEGDINIFFARKKKGWYVYEADRTDPSVTTNEQLFWSADKEEFRKLNFRKSYYWQSSSEEYANRAYDEYNYQRIPYYGYVGWDLDVIKDFGGRNDLSDSLTEGLARAYANYAMGFLWNQFAFTTQTKDIPDLEGTGEISEERIQNLIKNLDLDIASYKKLYEMNPRYQTKIGNVFVKYSNEILLKYHALLIAGRYDLAKQCLQKGLYGPTELAMAKNYLDELAPNAILFANGDNSIYPLLYLQETENYRKDVKVVGLSLLSMGRYAKMLKSGLGPNATSLPISWMEKYSLNDDYGYAKLNESSSENEQFHSIAELISHLSSDECLMEDGKNMVLSYPSNKLFFFAAYNDICHYNPMDTARENGEGIQLKFTSKNNYLGKQDIILLNIIQENHWRRPVYFIHWGEDGINSSFMKYYQTEGIVNRLVPIVSDSMDETGRVDTKIMYKNLMENFHWAEQFDDIPQKDLETIRLVREMRDIYNRLAMALIKEHKRELALKVTARMTQLFPKEKYPYFYDNIQTAELFFMLEKPNKALNILDDIIRNEKPEVFLPNNKDYERKKSRYIESLHSSADLAVRFGMSGFAEKYRRMEGQVK